MPNVVVDSEFRDKQEHPNSADFTFVLCGNYERRQCMCIVTLAHLWGDLGSTGEPYALVQFGNGHTRYPVGVLSNSSYTNHVQFYMTLAHAKTVYRSGSDMSQKLRISLGEYLQLRLLTPKGEPLQTQDKRVVAVFNITPIDDDHVPQRCPNELETSNSSDKISQLPCVNY